MRTTEEYLSLQLAYRLERLTAVVAPETLSTARFETVYRESTGFGMLDLLFESHDDIFVAHAVGVDVVMLATREGPALIWPATLHVAPAIADAVEELVTPWLLSLVRGRGMAGESIRAYRPSAVFDEARARKYRGAVPSAASLPVMAPFVYARRFAVERNVRVACLEGALAASVVATVARSVSMVGSDDLFARRWYDRPTDAGVFGAADVAIVDDFTQAEASGAAYVVATQACTGEHAIIVPVPVPQDHLFTFDPADAPEAARFAVRASDRVERPSRVAMAAPVLGGSGPHVALVVRDDASYAGDADTESCDELARRLRSDGIGASIMTASDSRVAQATFMHIFGGIDDKHVVLAVQTARAARLPYFISVEPLAPYAKYYEDALIATLRLCADTTDEEHYSRLFYERRARFDELPHELTADEARQRDRAFEDACSGAAAIFLSPCDAPEAFGKRFPQVRAENVVYAPVLLPPEPEEAAIAVLVPAQRFLLLHAPFSRRSTLGHVIASLGEASFGVVVAGPVSEVDVGFTLRRISGSGVIFLPDPTPPQIAALYRRAHAIAMPSLRPTGAARLIRAALCGVLPLVARGSPLARLVPEDCRFDERSRSATRALLDSAMHCDQAARVAKLADVLQPLADQHVAFRVIVESYGRAGTRCRGSFSTTSL